MAEGPAPSTSPEGFEPRWPGLWAAGLCASGVAAAHYGPEYLPLLSAWPTPVWIFALAGVMLIAACLISLRSVTTDRGLWRRLRSVLSLLATAGLLTALASGLVRLHHPPAHWLPDLLDPPGAIADASSESSPPERLLIVQGVVREHLAPLGGHAASRFDVHAPQRVISGVGFRISPRSRAQFTLEVTQVQLAGAMHPASGVLRVFSPQQAAGPLPALGATIELTGQYRPPRQFSRLPNTLESGAPGVTTSSLLRARLVHDRSAGSLSIDALTGPDAALRIIDPSPPLTTRPAIWLQHARLAVQQHLAASLDAMTGAAAASAVTSQHRSAPSPSASALLTSMMLGQDDSALSPPVESDLARLGMAHVLSVSGFHLVIITACIVWVARAMTDSHRTVAIITIAAIIIYTLMVPLESPVIRSACQAIAVVVAGMFQRRYEPLNLLGYIAAVMLLIWPIELWSAGFQLSFLVTGGLLAFGPRWMQAVDQALRWRPQGVKGRIRPAKQALSSEVLRAVRMSAAAIIGSTLLAQVLSCAIVIYHTGTLPLGGVVLGMIATPLTTIALIAGFAGLIFTLIIPPLGGWLLLAGGAICHVVLDITHITRGAPFLWADLPMIPAWTAMVLTGGIIILLACKRRWLTVLGALASIVGVGIIIAYCFMAGSLDRSLLARFERYDLTQQSPASLLHTRDALILIDPGTGLGIAPLEPPIRQAFALRRAIQSAHRWRIDTCIITGAEPWRFDLLPELITPLGISRVFIAPDLAAVARDQPGSPAHRLVLGLTHRQIAVIPMDATLTIPLAAHSQLTIAPGTLRLELSQGTLEIDRPPVNLATSRWSISATGASEHHRWLLGAWQRAWAESPSGTQPNQPPLLRWYPQTNH